MQIYVDTQEMVEAISNVIGGRTVNIMDNQGIIIASSDVERIGTFHEGAAKVIEEGKVVRIFESDSMHFEGAKEGINMPIIVGNKMYGVVGIYGNPDEVEEVANILAIYVKHHFIQTSLIKNEQLIDELRTQMLKVIIYGQDMMEEKVCEICSTINIEISYPIQTIVIYLNGQDADEIKKLKNLNRIASILNINGYINVNHDIYGVVDNCFILLKATDEVFLNYVYKIIKNGQDLPPTVVMGDKSESLHDVKCAYECASMLALSSDEGFYNMDDNGVKLQYLINSLANAGKIQFSGKIYASLLDYYGKEGIEEMMQTIEVYCKTSGSINEASNILHIHKNTMLYRIDRILGIMGVGNENKFIQECFLRIALLHYKRLKL